MGMAVSYFLADMDHLKGLQEKVTPPHTWKLGGWPDMIISLSSVACIGDRHDAGHP